ncbi:MAG: isoaspartyl peptidase/L-asparaginase family protein [Nitrospirota bacterium]
MNANPIILVHGGCGAKKPTAAQLRVIRRAIEAGYALLDQGASAVDAVEAAVIEMERSGLLNAGKGSKRQMDGVARMDASIMEGRTLAAGAVAAMEGILTPIRAARLVMERTPHVLLVGQYARRLARQWKIEPLGRRRSGEGTVQGSKLGTVGAVARDRAGHLAAATSTGGIAEMLPGRVGDSPLIGAGTYADDAAGAVSMTGIGEAIIRAGLAREICLLMEQGLSPMAAGRRALARMRRRTNGQAGAIILSAQGRWALVHTTPHMIGGYRSGRKIKVGVRFSR